ncbi:MAG: DUF885 family protein, partial [Planctomycetota bacterium]|nr:DUF885 family protein [Planctomycetota bacterium]
MINRTAFIGNGKAALVVMAWLMAGCAGASIDKMHDKKLLDGLCSEYWEGHLKAHPEEATSIGDRRYDDRLSDISSGGRAAEKTRLLMLREQIRAFPVASLSRGDRVTLASLRDGVENGLARASCEFETWVVDPLRGPQVGLLNLVAYHKASTPEQGQGMVSRWKAMGPYIDAHIANLRVGIDSKRVAVRVHVEKSLGQLHDLLETPVAEWPLLHPLEEPHEDWSEEERKAFRMGLTTAVEGIVRPAFERYRKFLQEEILPVARSTERPGVMHLSGGKEAYKRMIRV